MKLVPTSAVPDPALARALRALRTERGLTQEDLAHAAGVTVTAYARLERATVNPTWATVRSVAAALDISMAKLGSVVDRHQDR